MTDSWQYPGADPQSELAVSNARAGFWVRFAALFIDGIIVNIVGILLRAVFGSRGGSSLEFVLGLAYYITFIGAPRGQTLGAMVMKIRVVTLSDGGQVGYSRAAIRYVVSIISALTILIGYFWMLWDKEKQTWHDKAAGTIVVPVAAFPITAAR